MEITKQMVDDLVILRETTGWKTLCKILEERDIVTLREKLATFPYEDLEKRQEDVRLYALLKTLINLPDKYIAEGGGSVPMKDYDPYEKSKS